MYHLPILFMPLLFMKYKVSIVIERYIGKRHPGGIKIGSRADNPGGSLKFAKDVSRVLAGANSRRYRADNCRCLDNKNRVNN